MLLIVRGMTLPQNPDSDAMNFDFRTIVLVVISEARARRLESKCGKI
jgi:hypothetical protein